MNHTRTATMYDKILYMQGIGSNRWESHQRAYQIEQVFSVPIASLAKQLPPADRRQAPYRSPGHSGVVMLTIDLNQQQSTLKYGINGQPYTEAFDLVTSRPHFGGCRWWVCCPGCGRRRSSLYLPPDETRFRCRECHGLTYRSQQVHDKRVNELR